MEIGVFWRIAFLVMHVISVVAILMLYRDYNFVDPTLYETVRAQDSADVLSVAVQIGRLDLISMMLAVFAILIALAAIFAFIEIKSRAERVAEDAAKAIVDARVASLFAEAMKTRSTGINPVIDLTDAEQERAMSESTELDPRR